MPPRCFQRALHRLAESRWDCGMVWKKKQRVWLLGLKLEFMLKAVWLFKTVSIQRPKQGKSQLDKFWFIRRPVLDFTWHKSLGSLGNGAKGRGARWLAWKDDGSLCDGTFFPRWLLSFTLLSVNVNQAVIDFTRWPCKPSLHLSSSSLSKRRFNSNSCDVCK